MSSPASVVLPAPPTVKHPHLHSRDTETRAFSTLTTQPSNTPVLPLVQQTLLQAPSQWSAESIYRTITNRLNTLEANHTLYARYVEEQAAGVQEVLRKLNENRKT